MCLRPNLTRLTRDVRIVMGLTIVVPEGAGIVTEVEVPLDPPGSGNHKLILTATPSDGYEFDRFEWDYNVFYPDGSPPYYHHYVTYNNPTSGQTPTWGSAHYPSGGTQSSVSSNLKAYFKPKTQFKVSVSIVPDDAGNVEGGGEFYEGSNCMISTTPKCSPWKFDHWELTPGGTVRSRQHTFTVNQDTTCVAHYTHTNTGKPYYDADGGGEILCTPGGAILYDGDAVQ